MELLTVMHIFNQDRYNHPMSPNPKIGKITVPPGVFPERYEKMTVDFLSIKLRTNITFLVPRRNKGAKTVDISMDGYEWEIKCPEGRSKRTIENNLRTALKQSAYIILDTRLMDGRVPKDKRLHEIELHFERAKAIKRLLVITRDGDIVDFKH